MEQPNRKLAGAGGTPGGIGLFFLGFAMAAAGGWALTNQVIVSSEYFTSGFMVPVIGYRMQSFGMSLVPFIIGIAGLFFNAKSLWAWLLTVGGLSIILMGILTTMHIHFRATTLFHTLVMLVLLFGGLGLILRSFKSFQKLTEPEPDDAQQEIKK